MKSWKEQLRDVKRTLQADQSNEPLEEKPAVVDFVPPASWLEASDNSKDDTPSPGPKSSVIHGRRDPCKMERPPAAGIASVTTGASSERGGPGANNQKEDAARSLPGDPQIPEGARSPTQNHTASTPVFRPHVDAGRSLAMPGWADAGSSLQHPEQQGGRTAPMVVRVGVDFGTAFTKVAIRAGGDLVRVDWSAVTGDESPAGRYVIPGFVHRAPDGEYFWRRLAETDIQGNLKLPLIDMAGSDECPMATLAYLALVIRYARAFLYRHPQVGRKLAVRSLRWELNVGCPTEPHKPQEVDALFRRIARTAWQLAGANHLQDSNIVAAWMSGEADVGLETEPGVVPEFVAQIAGYLGSPQVSEGLHALIDIGAATLDVATFNVVLPNDLDSSPRIPIFFSAVRPLGTHYLYHNRHSRLDLDFAWDDAAPVEPSDGFAKRYGKRPDDVDAVDSEFIDKVARCIAAVTDGTRTNSRGDPRSSAWSEGLPIFVTGGGSSCELYRRAVDAGELDLKQRMNDLLSRFRFIERDPLGAKFPHFSIEIAGRLSVAIGLTEDAESIARVVPHREIGPIMRTVTERIDHMELYGD
ncbi:hypothetical protein FA213_16665 [Pseudomonas aeruginosa]|uniref:hypothetical protein n=1 Tax=Pseudomonas aeruginosa TaxID=287 RepID=UPI00053F15CF|nr:hypothetical protein [Pseudomonas aeruginosa]EIU7171652.1 hypothetical protein [Pseudomonas aeruginosa]EKW0096473.1 hypothetical protein [Pseudomonas aeruginosa]ELP1299450.1 hypothetical protein [Pseudomonas aeruginosa]MBG3907801.1 hypothetical protein [Pseudomonas aeruginosa]MBG6574143.1 hypothetical protein [Pseudomonas aeruginosa]